MPRPIEALIHTEALAHNLRRARQAAPQSRVWAVVKADAYDLELCSRLDLWHTVHHEAQIDMLAAHKTNAPHRVFLKMNSGMNRLGFRPSAYRGAWQRLSGLTQVDEITREYPQAAAYAPGAIL